ncbi:MAG: carbohydrate-binding domain-containing protein [Clostridia bacterium]|nr:carbohydrate-binding domain-containing protein [Clostridia bacterium]
MKNKLFTILLAILVVVSVIPVSTVQAAEIPTEGLYVAMHDSYGDTWNGNALSILTDTEYLGDTTVGESYEGSFADAAVTEADGLHVFWTAGEYAYECSFEIYLDGTEIFAADTTACEGFVDGACIFSTDTAPATEITVSFDAGGGTGEMEPVSALSGWVKLPLRGDFTPPEGKVFAAWSLNEGGAPLASGFAKLSASATVYALYKDVAPVYVGALALSDGDYFDPETGSITKSAPAGGYLHYADGVLTLKDFKYVVEEETVEVFDAPAFLCTTRDLTLVLTGENRIQLPGEGAVLYAYEGSLTVTGDGTLTTTAETAFSVADDFTLLSGTIVLSYGLEGIFAGGDVTLSGGALLTEQMIYNFTVSAEGSISVTGGRAVLRASYGLTAQENVTISGGALHLHAMTAIRTGRSIALSGGSVIIENALQGLIAGENVDISGEALFLSISSEDVAILLAPYFEDESTEENTITIAEGLTVLPEGVTAKNELGLLVDAQNTIVADLIVGEMAPIFDEDTYVWHEGAHWHLCVDASCPLDPANPNHRLFEGSGYGEHTETDGVCSVCMPEDLLTRDHVSFGEHLLYEGTYLLGEGVWSSHAPTRGGYAYLDDGTLTLHDFTLSTYSIEHMLDPEAYPDISSDRTLVLAPQGITLRLVGKNGLYNTSAGFGILVLGDLTVEGDGTLHLPGEDGIFVQSGDAILSGGTLGIHSYVDGISVYDGDFLMTDGVLRIDSGDGVYVNRGDVTVKGGVLELAVMNDGIDVTNGNVTVTGGSFKIKAGDNGFELDADEELANYAELAALTVSGGSFEIRAEDDGFDAEGALRITGGSFFIDAINDAIDGRTVHLLGGSFTLDAACCYVMSNEGVTLGCDLTLSPDGAYERRYGNPEMGEDPDVLHVIDVLDEDPVTLSLKAGDTFRHVDADKDHVCDVCSLAFDECVDTDSDHLCNLCGEKVSDCADADKNHVCDVCGEKASDCADADKNHACDTCGEKLSDCADADGDGLCDTCGADLSEGADLLWLWITLPSVAVAGGGGFALYWFVLRKRFLA